MIATAINAIGSTDFADDAAVGFIDGINDLDSMDCADIFIYDYSGDEVIANSINAGNSMGCAEDAAGVLIYTIDARYLMDCADIMFQMM